MGERDPSISNSSSGRIERPSKSRLPKTEKASSNIENSNLADTTATKALGAEAKIRNDALIAEYKKLYRDTNRRGKRFTQKTKEFFAKNASKELLKEASRFWIKAGDRNPYAPTLVREKDLELFNFCLENLPETEDLAKYIFLHELGCTYATANYRICTYNRNALTEESQDKRFSTLKTLKDILLEGQEKGLQRTFSEVVEDLYSRGLKQQSTSQASPEDQFALETVFKAYNDKFSLLETAAKHMAAQDEIPSDISETIQEWTKALHGSGLDRRFTKIYSLLNEVKSSYAKLKSCEQGGGAPSAIRAKKRALNKLRGHINKLKNLALKTPYQKRDPESLASKAEGVLTILLDNPKAEFAQVLKDPEENEKLIKYLREIAQCTNKNISPTSSYMEHGSINREAKRNFLNYALGRDDIIGSVEDLNLKNNFGVAKAFLHACQDIASIGCSHDLFSQIFCDEWSRYQIANRNDFEKSVFYSNMVLSFMSEKLHTKHKDYIEALAEEKEFLDEVFAFKASEGDGPELLKLYEILREPEFNRKIRNHITAKHASSVKEGSGRYYSNLPSRRHRDEKRDMSKRPLAHLRSLIDLEYSYDEDEKNFQKEFYTKVFSAIPEETYIEVLDSKVNLREMAMHYIGDRYQRDESAWRKFVEPMYETGSTDFEGLYRYLFDGSLEACKDQINTIYQRVCPEANSGDHAISFKRLKKEAGESFFTRIINTFAKANLGIKKKVIERVHRRRRKKTENAKKKELPPNPQLIAEKKERASSFLKALVSSKDFPQKLDLTTLGTNENVKEWLNRLIDQTLQLNIDKVLVIDHNRSQEREKEPCETLAEILKDLDKNYNDENFWMDTVWPALYKVSSVKDKIAMVNRVKACVNKGGRGSHLALEFINKQSELISEIAPKTIALKPDAIMILFDKECTKPLKDIDASIEKVMEFVDQGNTVGFLRAVILHWKKSALLSEEESLFLNKYLDNAPKFIKVGRDEKRQLHRFIFNLVRFRANNQSGEYNEAIKFMSSVISYPMLGKEPNSLELKPRPESKRIALNRDAINQRLFLNSLSADKAAKVRTKLAGIEEAKAELEKLEIESSKLAKRMSKDEYNDFRDKKVSRQIRHLKNLINRDYAYCQKLYRDVSKPKSNLEYKEQVKAFQSFIMNFSSLVPSLQAGISGSMQKEIDTQRKISGDLSTHNYRHIDRQLKNKMLDLLLKDIDVLKAEEIKTIREHIKSYPEAWNRDDFLDSLAIYFSFQSYEGKASVQKFMLDIAGSKVVEIDGPNGKKVQAFRFIRRDDVFGEETYTWFGKKLHRQMSGAYRREFETVSGAKDLRSAYKTRFVNFTTHFGVQHSSLRFAKDTLKDRFEEKKATDKYDKFISLFEELYTLLDENKDTSSQEIRAMKAKYEELDLEEVFEDHTEILNNFDGFISSLLNSEKGLRRTNIDFRIDKDPIILALLSGIFPEPTCQRIIEKTGYNDERPINRARQTHFAIAYTYARDQKDDPNKEINIDTRAILEIAKGKANEDEHDKKVLLVEASYTNNGTPADVFREEILKWAILAGIDYIVFAEDNEISEDGTVNRYKTINHQTQTEIKIDLLESDGPVYRDTFGILDIDNEHYDINGSLVNTQEEAPKLIAMDIQKLKNQASDKLRKLVQLENKDLFGNYYRLSA